MAKLKKTNQTILLWVVIVVIALLGASLLAAQRSKVNKPRPTNPQDTVLPKAAEGQATQPSVSSAPAGTISPTSSPQSSQNGSVKIVSPTQGSTVSSGSKVTGTAVTSSNRLYYRLKGGKSGQLALGSVSFSGNDKSSTPFSFELAFTNQAAKGGDQGVLSVFITAPDGSEQSIANVSVNIQE